MNLGALSLAVCLPIALWILRDEPESMGFQPDGEAPAAVVPGMVSAVDRTATADALRSPSFWCLSGGSSPVASP